jgi:hypothetical protein
MIEFVRGNLKIIDKHSAAPEKYALSFQHIWEMLRDVVAAYGPMFLRVCEYASIGTTSEQLDGSEPFLITD